MARRRLTNAARHSGGVDILAKAPLSGSSPDEPAAAPNTPGPLPASLLYPYTNPDSIDPMLRSLLAQRFGLTFHYEDRQLPSLTLTSVKPKLQKADPAHRTGCHSAPGPARTPSPTFIVTCQNLTMAQFAANLPLYAVGMGISNVVDATGLEGSWDFTLTFSRSNVANPFGGRASVQDNDPSGMNFFEAMEKQLGLKLEQTKRPGKVMVIDHLEEKPKEP